MDGYPWHEGNEERDREKGFRLLEKGVKIIRVRDNRLKQISKADIFYNDGERSLPIIGRLLKNLIENYPSISKDRLRIDRYLRLNELQNEEEYRKILSFLPGPLPEKSLAHLYPVIAEEWDYKKNAPLEPRMFTPGSDNKVWWKCSQGHEWEATIASRNKGSGCPHCYRERRQRKK